jgi:hypothetical protein
MTVHIWQLHRCVHRHLKAKQHLHSDTPMSNKMKVAHVSHDAQDDGAHLAAASLRAPPPEGKTTFTQ